MAVYRRYTPEKVGKERRKPKRSELQAMWETRILEAENAKEEWKEEFGVGALEAAYYGHQKPDHWTDRDWFTINLIFASAKMLKRSVCPRELTVRMKLSKSFVNDLEQILAMKQVVSVRQAVMQHATRQLKLWREARLAYLNSLWQFGCLKVGYSADMEDNPNAGALVLDDNGRIVYDSETGMPIMEQKYRVKTEEFFIDQVDPDCIVVDRYCGNDVDKTGRFIAQKMFIPLQELRDSKEYKRSVVDKLEPSALHETERAKLDTAKKWRARWQWETGTQLPENEIVVVYEIYDLYHKSTLTLARGAHDMLKPPSPIPPGVDLHPFIFLKFNERRDSFYPIPIVYNWFGPQYEYNLTRNQTAVHRKRFNRRYVYDKNKFDVDELAKLELGEDGTFAAADGMGALEPVKDAPVDPAVYFDTRQLREEFMETSGVGEVQRNIAGSESATEAEIIERRSRESELDEHEEMMEFLSEVLRKLEFSMEANLTQEGAVELVGPRGAEWIGFGPEHFEKIAGEVFFTVEAEESYRMTLQVERAQLLQLLEILGRNPYLALDDVLLRAVFDKFPALADNELLINRVRQLALFALQAQAGQGSGAPNSQSKQVESSSTKGEAAKSRQVATGK